MHSCRLPGDKHVGPFLHEPLSRSLADPAIAPCDYRYRARDKEKKMGALDD